MGVTLLAAVVCAVAVRAEPIAVRFTEGASHGFLRLRAPDGRVLADGESTQKRQGTRVTARLMFRFRDGSRYDETTIFSVQREYRLISEHVVQRGPAFGDSSDLLIDVASGMVTNHYTDKDEAKTATDHLDLPVDLANGIVQNLLKNVSDTTVPKSLPYVIATPKPRLVKLLVSVAGTDPFGSGSIQRPATHYVLKVDLGGVAGVVAPLIGKQPPDSHIWILHDGTPMFVRAMQPFTSDTPLWTIELAAPQPFAPRAAQSSR